MFVRRIVVMMIAPPGTPGQPIATNTVEIIMFTNADGVRFIP